ncbi:MAG TPA: adenylate/guanylate cyclase domain-containing protein [Acidimicrobiales bacterium]|jgi:adenylate cyclase|nr:adenylate/guanylate cyclase domain-containing protein [Acidimicrobiales bacterium]
MPLADDARQAGTSALSSWRIALAERMASLLQRDPDLVDTAVEVGVVDRKWLDEPGRHPLSTTTTLDMVQRFLERSVERRPSALTSIGLNAIQMLSWSSEAKPDEGVTTDLAIAFTDLEGFTRFTAKAGDEAASALLAEHQRRVGPVVRSRGGRIVKHLGDGLMLSFPSPDAAVYACLELLTIAPEPLRMRAGVHCGEVVATRDDVIGHVVNVSARVAESANGGEVVVTAAVRAAVGDLRGVAFSRQRKKSFKGVGELIGVCKATPA